MPKKYFFFLIVLELIQLVYSESQFCEELIDPGFRVGILQINAEPLNFPLELFSGIIDNQEYLFVLERGGRIISYSQDGEGKYQPSVFFDIQNTIVQEGETGLLSATIPRTFPQDPYLFVHYNTLIGNEIFSRISRWNINLTQVVVDMNSELIIYQLLNNIATNHKGGTIQFGIDNYLYIIFGDGAVGGDPQSPDNAFGKILRIDVSNSNQSQPFTIPPTNPFFNTTSNTILPEIYSLGFRNPFRWSIDPITNNIWIADVGLDTWEELNVVLNLSFFNSLNLNISFPFNFGWLSQEGPLCHLSNQSNCLSEWVQPNFIYPHNRAVQGGAFEGSAIIGGYVYRGTQFPELEGHYLFADVSGRLFSLTFSDLQNPTNPLTCHQLFDFENVIAGFGIDSQNEIYATVSGSGFIFKIVSDSTTTSNDNNDNNDKEIGLIFGIIGIIFFVSLPLCIGLCAWIVAKKRESKQTN